MPILIQKKCPTCGGKLELISSNKYECRCCHNVYEMNEGNTSLYDSLQAASTFRESLNFKQAEMLYKNMLKKYADDDLSDVYWNLLLCEQRVMFETDQYGEQFPSFYDIVPADIDDSEYYSKAMEYAQEYDTAKLISFMNLANKMKEAKNKYRTIKNTTKPYDIFICFKKSSLTDPAKLTGDYQLAMELYNNLSKDYQVFFSERSLNNIVVREYEPNIYHALYTSKIMLVICSDIDYLNSQWVRNEWSRFKMMSNTTAQAKSIIPIFRNNFTPEQLPYEIRSCQGIMDNMSLLYNLTQAVSDILRPVDKQAELAEKLKAEMQEQMKAQMEALKQQFAAQNSQFAAQRKEVYQSPAMPNWQGGNPAVSSKPIAHANAKYVVPYGTKEIIKEQLRNSIKLTSGVIPDTVTRIGDNAFYECFNLKSIILPMSVRSIGNYAFYKCTQLAQISIPDSVISIGTSVFGGCSELISITVSQGNTKYHGSNNCIIETATRTLVAGCKNSRIPEDGSVRSIGNGAFRNCVSLTNVTIPKSVKIISDYAFSECSELTSINFRGTKKEWKNIRKEPYWDLYAGKYTVHCTDGDLKKSIFQ
ncbi:MAG: leucine-rich repeat protein [Clostridia bacterium]|nr:leucine-rich repeat protein [Clostridia bacterium]